MESSLACSLLNITILVGSSRASSFWVPAIIAKESFRAYAQIEAKPISPTAHRLQGDSAYSFPRAPKYRRNHVPPPILMDLLWHTASFACGLGIAARLAELALPLSDLTADTLGKPSVSS